jgi:hypothetical protein
MASIHKQTYTTKKGEITSYVIKYPYLILADGLIEKIDDHISSNNIRFTRKWYQYKTKNSNHFNNIISVSDYNQLVK